MVVCRKYCADTFLGERLLTENLSPVFLNYLDIKKCSGMCCMCLLMCIFWGEDDSQPWVPVTCRYMPDTLWHFRFLAFPRGKKTSEKIHKIVQVFFSIYQSNHFSGFEDRLTLEMIFCLEILLSPSIKLNRLNSILLEKMKMDWEMSDDSTYKWQDAFVTSYLFNRWVQSRRAWCFEL